ncbi:hypothetical protein ACFL2V_00055 [Pseudomonadota bacterium]
MPAPNKSQLTPIIEGLMAQNQLQGENAADLAEAMAEVIATGLNMFLSQVKVAPGIACSPAATVAPGRLM